ncbi:Zn-ribbon domain-containing OB-fold protein, partial [Bradyrhizobium sp.]|uniref:Zn-ribbon domain-containing OB-fold protein n=1 Tax=Bradyrhizobium sp. TaxID=376 RepID=UPI003918E6A6
MINPIDPPRRKNPLLRTRLPASPPRARSRKSHGFTRAAAEGRFMLQRCAACNTFAYPARDACPSCLSADLPFVDAPRRGTLLAETTARVPMVLNLISVFILLGWLGVILESRDNRGCCHSRCDRLSRLA